MIIIRKVINRLRKTIIMKKNINSLLFNLFIIVFFISCKTIKKPEVSNQCHVFKERLGSEYKLDNEEYQKIVNDFNLENELDIDILRIESFTSYDYSENVKRVSITNNQGILKNNINSESIFISKIDINKQIEKNYKNFKYISCTSGGSSQYSYSFFVKMKGEIIMTFFSDVRLKELKKRQDIVELEFIELFENFE